MARPKKGESPKPKPAAKAKTGHNSEPSEMDKGTFMEFKREASLTLRALEEAQSAHQGVLKKHKAAGGNNKALMKVIRALRDPDQAALDLRAELRYRQWVGLPLGTQSNFLDDSEDHGDDHLTDTDRLQEILFQANEAGYRLGRAGGDRVNGNTFPAGTESHVSFDSGFQRGMETIAKEMGDNVTQIVPKKGAGAAAAAKGETKH